MLPDSYAFPGPGTYDHKSLKYKILYYDYNNI